MDSFKQQMILLTSIMVFLSAITIFMITVDTFAPEQQQANETAQEEDENGLLDVEIDEREGDGLIAQSINGLIALHEDFQTGSEIFFGEEENETQENETTS